MPSDSSSHPDASSRARSRTHGLIGLLVDVLLFLLLTANGVPAVTAELASFGMAFIGLSAWALRTQGGVAACGAAVLTLRLLAVACGTLALRGALFGLFWHGSGWRAAWALLPAAIVSWSVAMPAWRFAWRARYWQLTGAPASPEQAASHGHSAREHAAHQLAIALIGGAMLLRLLYLGQIELLPEETYYWNYGQHLDLSYLDHPPMVAWLIRVGTAVFGSNQFGVRFGALCASVVSAIFTYRLTRNLFGEAAALIALTLAQVLPFLFLTGLLMTPDAPLTACWAGTLYFLERALIAGQPAAWLPAGICLGLGLISKYTISLLVPAAALFIILDPQSRRWLQRWQPYGAALIAAVLFSPVIIWNARNGWASFAFQTARRLAEAPRFSLHRLLLSALVLLTPAGVVTLLLPAREGDRVRPQLARKRLFLILCIIVPLAVFVLFSLRHDVKVDWTGALWLAALPLIARTLTRLDAGHARGAAAFAARAWGPTAIICLLLFGGGLHYLALGLPGLNYSRHMELVPVGWRDLGLQIEDRAVQIGRAEGEAPVVVGMDRYAIASELAFYARDQRVAVASRTSEHLFGRSGLMYERWFPLEGLNGRTLLLVGLERRDVDDPIVSACSDRADPAGSGTLTRDAEVIHEYYYRVLHRFHADCARQEQP
ncbi:MAG: glycosyltransferase family 39 protein [Sinobacteraceae bacterium]|nr:glycosyltransferase family 39 protein [Nevskiaceae bacterium]